MIILMDRPLANDHPDGPASCKWSSRWTPSCKWLPGGTGLSQMILQMDRPLANDYPEVPASCNLQVASCKWSSGSTRFISIFLLILQQISYFPPINIIMRWSLKIYKYQVCPSAPQCKRDNHVWFFMLSSKNYYYGNPTWGTGWIFPGFPPFAIDLGWSDFARDVFVCVCGIVLELPETAYSV